MAINKIVFGDEVLLDLEHDTVAPQTLLKNYTAHDNRGELIIGNMPNNGGTTVNLSFKADQYSIPKGYHNGRGKVSISATEQAKIIAENIRNGVTILGVEGTYSGPIITAQTKTATPLTTQQTIQPDVGYDYLSNVVVNAIPYTEIENSSGGTTVTIG